MMQIDSFKILQAIGQVQEYKTIFACASYDVKDLRLTHSNQVIAINHYDIKSKESYYAGLIARLLNDAYNQGRKDSLLEFAKEITIENKINLEKSE